MERTEDKSRWQTSRGFNTLGKTGFSQYEQTSEAYVRHPIKSPERERDACKEVTRKETVKEYLLDDKNPNNKLKFKVIEPGKNLDTTGK